MLPFFDHLTFELSRLLLVNVLVLVFGLFSHLPSHMLLWLCLIFLRMFLLNLLNFALRILIFIIYVYYLFYLYHLLNEIVLPYYFVLIIYFDDVLNSFYRIINFFLYFFLFYIFFIFFIN